jgi:hypothetical protein
VSVVELVGALSSTSLCLHVFSIKGDFITQVQAIHPASA